MLLVEKELRSVVCLRLPGSLHYGAQAEKCLVIDEVEIVRLREFLLFHYQGVQSDSGIS